MDHEIPYIIGTRRSPYGWMLSISTSKFKSISGPQGSTFLSFWGPQTLVSLGLFRLGALGTKKRLGISGTPKDLVYQGPLRDRSHIT